MVYGASIAMSKHAERMYEDELEERARNKLIGNLETEIRNYEQKMDARSFLRRILDCFSPSAMNAETQYQVTQRVLRERKPTEVRSRAIPLEDLRREVSTYEEQKGFYDRILSEVLNDETSEIAHHQRNLEALNCLIVLGNNYEIQRKVLRERISSE